MVEDGHAGFFDAEIATDEVSEARVGQLAVDEGEVSECVLPGLVFVESWAGLEAVHHVAYGLEVVDVVEQVFANIVGVACGLELALFV